MKFHKRQTCDFSITLCFLNIKWIPLDYQFSQHNQIVCVCQKDRIAIVLFIFLVIYSVFLVTNRPIQSIKLYKCFISIVMCVSCLYLSFILTGIECQVCQTVNSLAECDSTQVCASNEVGRTDLRQNSSLTF